MNGDCEFPVKDLPETARVKEPGSAKTVSDDENQKTSEKYKLGDYQEVVDMAEQTCAQMKEDLNRLKQTRKKKLDLVKSKMDFLENEMAEIGTTEQVPPQTKPNPTLNRQTSNAISSGDTFGAINTIFNTISKTVNLNDIKNRSENNVQNKNTNFNSGPNVNYENAYGVEQVKVNLKKTEDHVQNFIEKQRSIKTNKLKKTPSKYVKKRSQTALRKSRPIKPKLSPKKFRIPENSAVDVNQSVPALTKRSKRVLFKTKFEPKITQSNFTCISSPFKKQTNNLVEIYHNLAIKESASSETNFGKIRPNNIGKMRHHNTPIHIPMLNLHSMTAKRKGIDILNVFGKQTVINRLSKNYELPTIASKLKRAAKCYLNVRTIPFCTAISTSPSHNIGIRIQQIMNLVKTQQLNENTKLLSLVAGKLNNKSITTLVSTISSKIKSRSDYRSECPIARNFNYQQMKEIAKTIPEESVEEVYKAMQEKPKISNRSFIMTGPSGDVKISNPNKLNIWTNGNKSKACTCISQCGQELHQIISKYKIRSTPMNQIKPKDNTNIKKWIPPRSKLSIGKNVSEHKAKETMVPKERKLKEVLEKLHEEFLTLYKKQEELSKKGNDGTNTDDILHEMETLEKELNTKEDEIEMVMNLYQEVHALKEQVKTLREKTSKEVVTGKGQKIKTDTHSHLSKLLKDIKRYQNRYKKN